MTIIPEPVWEKILLPLRWVFFIVLFLGSSLHPLKALEDGFALTVLGLILIWRTYEHFSIGMKHYRFKKDPGKHSMVLFRNDLFLYWTAPRFQQSHWHCLYDIDRNPGNSVTNQP